MSSYLKKTTTILFACLKVVQIFHYLQYNKHYIAIITHLKRVFFFFCYQNEIKSLDLGENNFIFIRHTFQCSIILVFVFICFF